MESGLGSIRLSLVNFKGNIDVSLSVNRVQAIRRLIFHDLWSSEVHPSLLFEGHLIGNDDVLDIVSRVGKKTLHWAAILWVNLLQCPHSH